MDQTLAIGADYAIDYTKEDCLNRNEHYNLILGIGSLLENGRIKPVIDRRYTLDKTADAMNYLSQRHSAGKVIIMVE
jgi:NADPH:quinone reductase-like Zn-dependent oxidoreductase